MMFVLMMSLLSVGCLYLEPQVDSTFYSITLSVGDFLVAKLDLSSGGQHDLTKLFPKM